IEQQHIAGEVAKADDVRAGLAHGIVRVLGHGHSVLVREGDRPEVERLLEKPEQAMALLEPVPPVDSQRSLGAGRVQEDESRRPAILHRKTVQEAEDLWHGVHREAHDGDESKMAVADPRSKASDHILRREYGIEIHRNGGHTYPVPEPGDTGVEVREKRSGVQALKRETGGERILDVRDCLLEDLEDLIPAVMLLAIPFEEERRQAGLDLGRRAVGQGEVVRTLEVGALGGVALAALVVDESSGWIREGATFRVPDTGAPD